MICTGISVGAKDYCFPSTVAALHAGAQSRIHEVPPTLKMLMLMGEYLSVGILFMCSMFPAC